MDHWGIFFGGSRWEFVWEFVCSSGLDVTTTVFVFVTEFRCQGVWHLQDQQEQVVGCLGTLVQDKPLFQSFSKILLQNVQCRV